MEYVKTLNLVDKNGEEYSGYSPSSGSFTPATLVSKNCVRMPYYHWFSCREQFAYYFTSKTKGFLFVVSSGNSGKRVAAFIEEVEKRLGFEKFTVITGIKNKNFCFVKISPWWVRNSLRRELFTILLRCGRNYKGNFEKTLYSNHYSKITKRAIEKFFEGNTYFSGRMKGNKGWVSKFEEPKEPKKPNLYLLRIFEMSKKRVEDNLKKLYKPNAQSN